MKKHEWVALVWLASVLLLLMVTGCGGGGEEEGAAGSSTPAPKQISTDTAAAATAAAQTAPMASGGAATSEPSPAPSGAAPAAIAKRRLVPKKPVENPFVDTAVDATSTFAVDVDTASYTTVRSLLEAGVLPPPDRIRIEEMLNYLRYSYPSPPDKAFGFMADTVRAPAGESFLQGGTNRVLVATDGDFNMGMTSRADLHALIERMAATGVYLTMLGFGRANPQDRTMELLADRGNGNYAFIDSAAEARRFLARELTGTLVTIAKDVKIQAEWNPKTVRSFRLIGSKSAARGSRLFG